ncbi:MAG: ribonuclease HII [Clostridia bacterium]|nr:ribonuclease HII [Clostridia bacterium]
MNWDYENKYFEQGYTWVCGTDEAGRGPLAGPVVAAAVILPEGLMIEGLNDSKKLSEKKREKLYDIIREEAVSFAICEASVEEIDTLNILNASQLAMRRCVEKLVPKPEVVLVDGNIARDFPIIAEPVIKGDALSPYIAAASILANVTRDRMLVELDSQYPEYNFKKHKGYPTKEHREAVIKYGPSPVHRKTFLKFLNNG